MNKKLLALLSLLLFASMILAACAPAATQAPEETEEMMETEEPAMFECTDEIGCVELAPGDPVHVEPLRGGAREHGRKRKMAHRAGRPCVEVIGWPAPPFLHHFERFEEDQFFESHLD